MEPRRSDPRPPAASFSDPQVNLYVADTERSTQFYRERFGFTETYRTPKDGPAPHIEMRIGSRTLGFATYKAAKELHGVPAGEGPPRGEVVLWTEDVNAAFRHLVERGARPLREPEDFLGTLRNASVLDPDGNPVQIEMKRSTRGAPPGSVPATHPAGESGPVARARRPPRRVIASEGLRNRCRPRQLLPRRPSRSPPRPT
ncbi:MAG: VOC family protein [Thermoplasmata archaeon]